MSLGNLATAIKAANSVSFIIGAGASSAAGIPLARDVIKDVNNQYGHCLKKLTEDEKTHYGKVMAELSTAERQTLIEGYLNRAKLNWGHVALATIAQQSNVKRILSFNFDFLLEQAFSMLGVHLPVYDFAVAPAQSANIVQSLAQKAIFHLHGQSYGLKLLNSETETNAHCESLRPLIADTLHNHVTIVTGYSGCADGAFQVIQTEFTGHNRLFWLGYDDTASATIASLFDKDYAEYIGGCDFDHSMIEIAQGLESWPPPIIDNPPTHVLQQLDPLPDFPLGKENETAVLYETKLHLERLAKQWPEDRSEAEIEASALMAGLAVTDPDKDLSLYSDAAKDIRAWRLIQKGNALLEQARTLTDKAQAQAQGYENAIEKYAEAIRIKPDKHDAFNNWGLALLEQAKTLTGKAQAACFENAGEKYAEAIRIKPDFHTAFNNWGIALFHQAKTLTGKAQAARFENAGEKYAEAIRIKPDDHEAFNNWGTALLEQAGTVSGDEQSALLRAALEKLQCAKKLDGRGNYNLACAHALLGNDELALDELEACHSDETLPNKDHLDQDTDLDSLRDTPRFAALFDPKK